MTWPLDDVNPPSCRSLSAAALESLVTHVTSHPDLWEPTVDRTSLHRMYAALHRDAVVDVWAIFCRPGNDTGWHDHDTSSGAVRVVEGALTESQRVGAPHRCRVYRAGDCFSFDASHIHRLVCEDACVISIHAYSASVRRLGQHNLDRSGARHQVSVTYTDELRPLELPAA